MKISELEAALPQLKATSAAEDATEKSEREAAKAAADAQFEASITLEGIADADVAEVIVEVRLLAQRG